LVGLCCLELGNCVNESALRPRPAHFRFHKSKLCWLIPCLRQISTTVAPDSAFRRGDYIYEELLLNYVRGSMEAAGDPVMTQLQSVKMAQKVPRYASH
jgi:hypothetical protein